MMNLKQFLQIGLVATMIGVSAIGQATDGTVGVTSTGTMALSVTVPTIVVIKNVIDPAPATFNGSTAVTFNTSVCVGSNNAAGGYTIQADSATGGAGSPFQLTDTVTNVAYNVAWANSSGAASGTAFANSGAVQNFAAGPVSNIGCAATNATVLITVPAANLQAAPASTYLDTLSLTVAPL